jgi:hypothetical protein
MNKHPENLDAILDAALHGYSNAEPRPGLEQRVLRRIQTAPGVRRSWWKFGWAAAPVCLAFFFWMVWPTRDVPRAVLSLAPPPVPAVARVIYPKTPARDAKPRILRAKPLPLTAEERALLRFVQEYPEQARAALVLSAQIEEIAIKPLEIEALQ